MLIVRRKLFLILSIIFSITLIVSTIVFLTYSRYDYTYVKNGNYYVLDKAWGNDDTYLIPNFYKDIPVNTIGEKAFSGKSRLKHVIFQDDCNITVISRQAFSECINLESIDLPEKLFSLDQNVFLNCHKLSTVNFIQCRFIGGSVFYNCTNLEEIILPTNLYSIGSYAFTNTKIKGIYIPQSVYYLYGDVFYNALYLENIYIFEERNYTYDYLSNSPAEITIYTN